jgi:hypothetical protein
MLTKGGAERVGVTEGGRRTGVAGSPATIHDISMESSHELQTINEQLTRYTKIEDELQSDQGNRTYWIGWRCSWAAHELLPPELKAL